jgi:hypothetical protein
LRILKKSYTFALKILNHQQTLYIMRGLFAKKERAGSVYTWLLALCAFCLMPTNAWAYGNDYLEKQNHYPVTVTGADVIHFVIPVYS